MKKILLILFLISAITLTAFGLTGTYTTNGYFYMPGYGSYGTSEFDEYEAYMQITDTQIASNKTEARTNKWDGTSAPGVTNDTDEGYIAGSTWVDVTNDKAYVCLDNTDGAAVWTEVTQAGGGSGTVTTSGTPVANDIARFTGATVIEGRSYTELKADLDLEIGTDVEAHDDGLLSIAGLTTAANKSIYTTALDTYAVYDLTAFARTILDDADASAVRTTLGLVYGTNVQAYDDGLLSLAGLTYASDSFIKVTAEDTYAIRTIAETQSDLSIYTNLTSFVDQTAWRVFYSNVAGDVVELVLGADGTYLESNGAAAAPTFTVPAGAGDVSKVGTPVDNQVGVWTGDGTIEGAASFTYDGSNLQLTGDIGSTGTRITKGWYTDLQVTNTIVGSVTSNATGLVSTSNADITIQPNGTGDTRIYAPADIVTTKTAVATLTIAEAGTVLVSCAATPYTITLPTASGHTGLRYHFIKTDANYFLITLDGNAAETFNYENSTGAPVATYARLNTYCAEVTIVSDGTNWQVINEVIGLVPTAWMYVGGTQENIPANLNARLELDTAEEDIGSNFRNGTWITSTASATEVNHLHDTNNSPFTTNMVGCLIKNTTDSTETYISSYISTSDVILKADIFASGETYLLKRADYLIPIAGRYLISSAATTDASTTADKRYGNYIYKNNVNQIATRYHASIASYLGPIPLRVDVSCSKDDVIKTSFYNGSNVGTVDIHEAKDSSFLRIRLISKE